MGGGALSAIAGLSYAHFRFPWSGYASVEVMVPTLHQPELEPQRAARATLAGR